MLTHFKVGKKEIAGLVWVGCYRFGCGKSRELSSDGFYFLNESVLKVVGGIERKGEVFKDWGKYIKQPLQGAFRVILLWLRLIVNL